ncbi:putative transcription factor C2H2 family [Rosa chinensis]|uniref:Putative transcription factor C2H2 family n=1 Tax=Rosa chinensis TaxID=74649 RepID=A0A2P6R9F9_ROSCH|nr:putative transcription factor C2H2 family [Rosa chinensis]
MDLLPLTLSLFKLSVHCVGSATNIVYGIPRLVTQKQTSVPLDMLPYQKRGFTRQIAQYLSTMGVPEDEQFSIIARVFEVIEDKPVLRLPITLAMADVTVRTTPDGPDVSLFGSQMKIDEATWELMERYRNGDPLANYRDPMIVEALDFVLLDSLEPAIRQTPCLLCKESPDHFVRLPCSHLHHKSCIFRWLGSCHLCPSLVPT